MTTTPTSAPASAAASSRSADVAAFVAGGLAAALGIAIGELMAGLVPGAPSLVIAIGDTVIENQPPGAKELIVELFGSNNKLALNVGIIVTAILIAGLLGVAGRRSWTVPVVGFGVAAAAGLLAAFTRPLVEPLYAVFTLALAVLVALGALRLMLSLTRPAWSSAPPFGLAPTCTWTGCWWSATRLTSPTACPGGSPPAADPQ